MAKPVRLPSGKWRNRWKDHAGVRRSQTFGSWNEAQKQLRQVQAETDAIVAGVRRAPPERKTFDDLIEYWLTKRAVRKRSGSHDHSIIRRHLRPSFAGLPLGAVDVERIDEFMVERSHLAPKTVSNLVTLLITMLNCACDLGWLDRVPRVHKPKVRMFARDFRYLRNDEEVRRFLRVAQGDGLDAYALYTTAIYTGMRQGELAALRWADVDLEKRLVTVQSSFQGPTKAGDVRYVPILDPLLLVLREWRLKAGGCWYVFPTRRGTMHTPGARIFQERMHRILDAAGFPRPPEKVRDVHYICFHSLRHTFASHWVMNGGDLFKLQKILGHKTVQMTQRYAHLQPSAFADDYARMPSLLPTAAAEVVPLVVAAEG